MSGKKLMDDEVIKVTGGASAQNTVEEKVPCCGLCMQPVVCGEQVRIEGGNTGTYKCTNFGCKNCKSQKILYNNDIKWLPAAK